MGWLEREPSKLNENTERKSIPSGVWDKCTSCGEIILTADLIQNLKVCPMCGYHNRISAAERIEQLTDTDSFQEWDADLFSKDPLEFNDGKPYHEKLSKQRQKSNQNDAVITGVGRIQGRPVALGALDFFWMGGSMGTVMGERLSRLFVRAGKLKLPVVVISASGGARMHEGILSLMQMAKTCARIAELRKQGLPYISIMCDPTTGGVAASFAMLGDINLAEPRATIGFAGRRVIENTIRQKLPDDFQTAEFLLAHGMIDRIVRRQELPELLSRILAIIYPDTAAITHAGS
jgi:acetyl-CoA carboxylase carboxyl transferase subunit beta